jgi:hypothetical protein
MGRPHFYVVVADDEIEYPKTSAGMVNFRAEIAAYRYINADPGRRGMPQGAPYGFFNHLMDAQRMVAAHWFANITPLSSEERRELDLPESVRKSAIDAEPDPNQKERPIHARQIALMRQAAEESNRHSSSRACGRRSTLASYQKLMRQRF